MRFLTIVALLMVASQVNARTFTVIVDASLTDFRIDGYALDYVASDLSLTSKDAPELVNYPFPKYVDAAFSGTGSFKARYLRSSFSEDFWALSNCTGLFISGFCSPIFEVVGTIREGTVSINGFGTNRLGYLLGLDQTEV